MAIGIDRIIHRKLIESLLELSKNTVDDLSWISLMEELKIAYDQAKNTVDIAEQSIYAYNQLQISVRTRVAKEQRNRKRKFTLLNAAEE